jgi:hypothetical protein
LVLESLAIFAFDSLLPNIVAKWLTSLLYIQKVSASNLGMETSFPQPLQANAGIVY